MSTPADQPRTEAAHGRRPVRALLAVLMLAASLVVVAGTGQAPVAAAGPFEAHGSVNQVYTFGHPAGSSVQLLDAGSGVFATGVADAQGAYLFRDVPAGTGYQVSEGGTTVTGITVTAPTDNPDFSWYQSHQLGAGVPGGSTFTYIPTRDGTLLSANITFPHDGTTGPWPVLIDYSGYDPSEPPSPPQEAQMWPWAGYVVVGINLRGTTCSGGAFDLWETLQTLDGYDSIETLAAQSWSNGHVGMVGISYMGISQLFVAQTHPPHLDAISPLSTYADFYGGIGYPGGIINVGFFLGWLGERDADSNPAAHGWVQNRIATGDTVCAQNQVMRLQSRKLLPQAVPNRFYETRGDYLSPTNFVNNIQVPTFLVGQFQDEQTGGYWSTMVSHFRPTTKLKVQLTNGTHVEGMGPEHLPRLMEFIDFYVGHRIPRIPGVLRVAMPDGIKQLFNDTAGAGNYGVPADRFGCYFTPAHRPPLHPPCTGPPPATDDYAGALAKYESEGMARVSWENGNGPAPDTAGEPFSSAQNDYASWPPPGVTPTAYYFQPDGTLSPTPPTVPDTEPRGMSSYQYDPNSKNPKRTFTGSSSDIWSPLPAVNWKPLTEGNSLNFVSDPFTKKTALAGSASADVWIRSTELDTDLEVTLTEVRPDGKETYIQGGWLRASRRALAPGSTDLRPLHSQLAGDAQDLPAGQFSLARVEIYPFAHVLRPGSRLRINIEVPGGNQAFWQVEPMAFGHPVTDDVGHSVGRPSRIVLPVLPDAEVPAVPVALPPCPALRGQACRAYLPARIVTGVTALANAPDIDVNWSPPPSTAANAATNAPAPVDSYHVVVQPTGESFDVPGTTTSFTYANAALDTPFTFTVAAVYGTTTAPASDASLSVTIPSQQPTTTTTSTTTTAPPTTEPSDTTGADQQAALDTTAPVSGTTTTTSSGTLPVTGSEVGVALFIAVMLIAGGTTMRAASRRRRAG